MINFLSLLLIMYMSPTDSSLILGKWQTPKENSVIEIKQNGNVLEGVVIKSENKKAVGQKILRNLKEVDGSWKGNLYAIDKDKLLDITLKPKEDHMEVKVLLGWFSKSSEWKRIVD